MKSIKEKSEEHLNSVYAGYDNVLKKLVKEGYASGANYVLEELEKECRRIEQLFKNYVENSVNKEDKVDALARLDEMEYMLKFIEQLKK